VSGNVHGHSTQRHLPGETLNNKDRRRLTLRNHRDRANAEVLPAAADVERESRIVGWAVLPGKG